MLITLICILRSHQRELLCNIVNQTLRLLPAEAGVGYRLAVNGVVADLLAAVLEIALDHKTLYIRLYLRRLAAAMKYLLAYAYLLLKVLALICVVGINDDRHVL